MAGVIAIDKQHKKLIDMFDRLNEAVKNHEPRENIFHIIDDVISFTRVHFATEEQLMVHSGYPEVDAHRDKHKELINDTLRLKGKLEYVGEQMFTEWLTHWPFASVLAHIQFADQQVEDHITRMDNLQRNLQRKAD